jgi:Raf kinase inhibitor-like YbhB/YbcL family protein
MILFSLALLSACSDDPEGGDANEECTPGEPGCECLEDRVCTGLLTCVSGTCSTPPSGTGGADAATGGGNSGGNNSGGLPGSGGAATGGSATGGEENGTGGASSGEFSLTSSELAEGGTFLPKHTCQMSGFDNDESPPLAWSGAPEGTMSYAITFIDRTLVDEGNVLGYHWAIWNLSESVMALPANLPSGLTLTDPVSATQSRNSYLGPCPFYGQNMPGAEPHIYEFTIFALPTETATISGSINAAMITALENAALGSATLSGESTAYSQF